MAFESPPILTLSTIRLQEFFFGKLRKYFTLVMLTLEEISELDADMGGAKPMDEYLENFDTNIQSKTPYSDVTQVSTTLTT